MERDVTYVRRFETNYCWKEYKTKDAIKLLANCQVCVATSTYLRRHAGRKLPVVIALVGGKEDMLGN